MAADDFTFSPRSATASARRFDLQVAVSSPGHETATGKAVVTLISFIDGLRGDLSARSIFIGQPAQVRTQRGTVRQKVSLSVAGIVPRTGAHASDPLCQGVTSSGGCWARAQEVSQGAFVRGVVGRGDVAEGLGNREGGSSSFSKPVGSVDPERGWREWPEEQCALELGPVVKVRLHGGGAGEKQRNVLHGNALRPTPGSPRRRQARRKILLGWGGDTASHRVGDPPGLEFEDGKVEPPIIS